MSDRRHAQAPNPAGWSYRPAVIRVTTLLTTVCALLAIGWGWSHREQAYLTPQEGAGYALGIVGGSLMLLLALYPARKHVKWMRHWGAVRHWFRMHMVFGLAGPIAILYHCNFSTGATNSNIALYSMLIVASSGIAGRYLYAAIHQGLYGHHVRLDEVRETWERTRMQAQLRLLPGVEARVAAYEQPLAALHRTLPEGVWRFLVSGWQAGAIRRQARRALRQAKVPETASRAALQALEARLDAARRVYRYNAFERLFSLWHLLHLPLYFMLIVTGLVHVVAVNLY